ncbi:hypothetical protein GCM10010172_48790 [Paractinoplanes ferrugineus]|uniref:CobE/GbiG C-terminal domain-containing protein n=1 Tax=Paractinoplanes ferrugineus TaxID=113564 RepID=A0A919IYG1_9ACTN|nr:hypothetical protein Afe05nite_29800 [Actinoplanes ferrugineus]
MRGGLVVGVGARTGVSVGELEVAVGAALGEIGVGRGEVGVLATIGRRARERGVREFAAGWGWVLCSVGEGELGAQDVPNRSATVAAAVGVPSVAEAAALAVTGAGGRLILPKRVLGGVVVAVACRSGASGG